MQTPREAKKLFFCKKKVLVCPIPLRDAATYWTRANSLDLCMQIDLSSRRKSKYKYFFDKYWPSIVSAYPGITLTLFGPRGDDPIPDYISKYTNVMHAGYVDNLDQFITQFLCMLMPLHHFTGISTNLLTAAALRIPTLATPSSLKGINSVYNDLI